MASSRDGASAQRDRGGLEMSMGSDRPPAPTPIGDPGEVPVDASSAVDPQLVPRMLRVTAAMGLSGAAVLAFSALRSKLVAIELGPEGLGSLALLLSFLGLVTVVGGFGVGSAAVREVAAAAAERAWAVRDGLRRALYATSWCLALLISIGVAAAAGPIAREIFGDAGLIGETRVCAVAALLGLLATAPVSEINGFRRIRDLASLQTLSAAIATGATVCAYLAGWDLIPVVLIAPPAALMIVASIYARRLPPRGKPKGARAELAHASQLIRVGSGFVLNAGLAAASALVVRTLVESELGRGATGEFQAAFILSTYPVTLVYAAYATDYLPLLGGLRRDSQRLNEAANTQLMLGILLAGPALILLIALADVAIPLLYSGAFTEAPDLLRLMLVAEILRLSWWTVGYALIARNLPSFVSLEVFYNLILVGATAALIPSIGLDGAGIAYLVAQAAGFVATIFLVRRATGFRFARSNTWTLLGWAGALTAACAAMLAGVPGVAWLILLPAIGLALVRLRKLGAFAGDPFARTLRDSADRGDSL
jgi:PST family polysaccharide transporter